MTGPVGPQLWWLTRSPERKARVLRASIAASVGICALLLFTCGTGKPALKRQPPVALPVVQRPCPNPTVGPNVQVTTVIGESNAPELVWTGDSFFIAWWDLRGKSEVYTVRVDRRGVQRSPAEKLPADGVSRDQHLVWDGDGLVLVWVDSGQVKSARVGSGEPKPVVLSRHGREPAAGFWGAAAWVEGGGLLFRTAVMAQKGKREGLDPVKPMVAATGGIAQPAIGWSGKVYGIAWSSSVKGGREIAFQRVSPLGQLVGARIAVSSQGGVARKPVVVWTADRFAVVWVVARTDASGFEESYQVFLALLPEELGGPIATHELELGTIADKVAVVFNGAELGLAWVGPKEPQGSAIFLGRAGLDGELLGQPLEVTDGSQLTCGTPSLAWTGDGFAVAWHDDRGPTGNEVFFAFATCGEESKPEPALPADAGPTARSDEKTKKQEQTDK